MSAGVCFTCAAWGPVELHHVAGRHNIPEFVVPVCPDCHRILTNWQYSAGIELHAEAARDAIDIRRALCVGVMHLVQLIQQRSEHPIPAPDGLWRITARAISRVLDLTGEPNRAGRWLPDSTIEPHTGLPTEVDPRHDEVRELEFTYLFGAVLRLMGDMPPLTVELWDKIATDPGSLPARFAAMEAADHVGPSIAVLITQHVEAAMRVMHWFATVEDWTRIDELDLDEARVWLDTGYHILFKIARAVESAADSDA